MKVSPYKDFSLKLHQGTSRNQSPATCQFELTFTCGLHCRHCYTDCYNQPRYVKKELSTKKVKFILDRLRSNGILWLCFTGGDPLIREDFLELYSYARSSGFIITIFTNAYSINEKICSFLKENPPFQIEITLNAATEGVYEMISQVRGSFKKVMRGINLILKAGLSLKIKTDVMKSNVGELPKIKDFLKNLGLKFSPNVFLHGGLDGNLTGPVLRISPHEVLGNKKKASSIAKDCSSPVDLKPSFKAEKLFRCAITGGGGIYIDPYGNTFPCNYIRKPRVSLLEKDVLGARRTMLEWIRTREFGIDSECRTCAVRANCNICPGRALLETKKLDSKISWFCELAHIKYASNVTPHLYAKVADTTKKSQNEQCSKN
jgi:radical SAM protein with 4Fe4S-binding SPASM domain